jgi:hypothetical protein
VGVEAVAPGDPPKVTLSAAVRTSLAGVILDAEGVKLVGRSFTTWG